MIKKILRRSLLFILFCQLIVLLPILGFVLLIEMVKISNYFEPEEHQFGKDTMCVLGKDSQYQVVKLAGEPKDGKKPEFGSKFNFVRVYALTEDIGELNDKTLLRDIKKYKFYWGTLCMVDTEGDCWTFNDKTEELKKVVPDDLSKGLKKTFDGMMSK